MVMDRIGADKSADTLIYVHDPMCSWCWGFRPTLEALLERLPASIGMTRLLGGLAPDSEQPMPAELQERLQQTWHRIQQRIPGTRFNFAFWTQCQPRRSTWRACRAVIAARALQPAYEDTMIAAIQHAYYLEARNPADTETLVALAAQIGLDPERFAARLDHAETQAVLDEEMAMARQMGADSFPSLRLRTGGQIWPVPVDYRSSDAMLETIAALRSE